MQATEERVQNVTTFSENRNYTSFLPDPADRHVIKTVSCQLRRLYKRSSIRSLIGHGTSTAATGGPHSAPLRVKDQNKVSESLIVEYPETSESSSSEPYVFR